MNLETTCAGTLLGTLNTNLILIQLNMNSIRNKLEILSNKTSVGLNCSKIPIEIDDSINHVAQIFNII